jgi:predicted DNA-binding WGR domain protein
MPRFELKSGTSSKFWDITLDARRFTTRYGRIGTEGQSTAKEFATPAIAKAEYEKLIAEKLKKGYRPVEGARKRAPVKKAATRPDAKTSAALEFAALLAPDDATLSAEVRQALDEPARYFARFRAALDDRNVASADVPELPWMALVIGLESRGRLHEIDWKDGVREVAHAVNHLLSVDPTRFAWADEPRYDALPTPKLLHVFGAALKEKGQTLASLDTQSDCYCLMVLDEKVATRAQALARRGFGRIVVWDRGPLPKAPAPRRGPAPERLRLPFRPSRPWVEAAGHVAVFSTANPDRSVFCDLRSWPPRLVERDEDVKSMARGPDGTFLIAAERNFVGSVRRVRDPFADGGELLAGVAEKELSRVGFVGDRALVVSGEISSRSRAYLEHQGRLRPIDALPAQRDSDGTAIVPLGDGHALVVWGNRAWELGGKQALSSFSFSRDDLYTLSRGATVPIGSDGFYFPSGGGLGEVHRGQKVRPIDLTCGSVSAVRAGPAGSLMLSTWKKGSPVQIEIYFPVDRTIIRLDRRLLGVREHWWAAWAGDRLWLLDKDTYDLVSLDGATVLAQPRSRAR